MSASMWKAVAVALGSGLLGAGATFAFVPDHAEPAPPPRTQQTDDEWLPKEGRDPRLSIPWPPVGDVDLSVRPTAFPNLWLPDIYGDWRLKQEKDLRAAVKWYAKQFENLCPRLHGLTKLDLEPSDDMQRKLLKSRLNQAVGGCRLYREIFRIGSWARLPTAERFECLTDVRTTATALWGDQPKELVLWLEEVVLATKEMEQYVLLRVVNGTDPPQALNYARRHRLKAEAELWKVKNAQ